MIIDTHCHVIATDTKRYPLKPLFGKQSDWAAEHPLDYPDMVKANVAAGVDKAILVQASSAYAFDNSYVSDSVAAHPERFTGVFSIDVVAPDAVQKMKHWMGKDLTGMRIFTSGSTHAEQETFFAERRVPGVAYASDLGSVCMQMRARCRSKRCRSAFPKTRVSTISPARRRTARLQRGGATVRARNIPTQSCPRPLKKGYLDAGNLLGKAVKDPRQPQIWGRISRPRRSRCRS